MRGAEADSKQVETFRCGRRHNQVGVYAACQQAFPVCKSALPVRQDDSGYRPGLVASESVTKLFQGTVEPVDIVPEPGSEIRASNNLGQFGAGRGNDRRRGRCSENVGSCGQPQQFQLGMRAGAESADAAKALGKRADDEVDLAEQSTLFGQAEPAIAEDAERMRLVEQQPGVVALLDFDEFGQRRLVAEHRVKPFHNDQRAAGVRAQARKPAVQVFRIVMAEDHRLSVAEFGTVVDAGVGIAVEQQEVVLAGQRGNAGEIGLVAGREDHGRRPAESRGKLLLQRCVAVVAAVGHPGARGAGAEMLQRLSGRTHHVGVQRKAQVIVGAGENHPLAVDDTLGGGNDVIYGRGYRRRALGPKLGARGRKLRKLVEQTHRGLSSIMVRRRAANWFNVCTSASTSTGTERSSSSSISMTRSMTWTESSPTSLVKAASKSIPLICGSAVSTAF